MEEKHLDLGNRKSLMNHVIAGLGVCVPHIVHIHFSKSECRLRFYFVHYTDKVFVWGRDVELDSIKGP